MLQSDKSIEIKCLYNSKANFQMRIGFFVVEYFLNLRYKINGSGKITERL